MRILICPGSAIDGNNLLVQLTPPMSGDMRGSVSAYSPCFKTEGIQTMYQMLEVLTNL